MKTFIIILIIIVALIFILFIIYCILIKNFKKNAYLYPKNGHFYTVFKKCKLKNPTSGEWMDAIIYVGVEDGNYYVREKNNFLSKFVKFKNIKDAGKNK